MQTENVLRPGRRDTPRDKDCTWGVLRNAFCGSCGCIDDDNDESGLFYDQPSSSSGEWKSQNITPSRAELKRGLENLTLEGQGRNLGKKLKKPKCSRLQNYLPCCRTKANRYSSTEYLNTEMMREIQINSKQTTKFPSNHTVTAKYTMLNFLPIFLYDQFRRYSNVFFLCMAILQQIPGASPTGRYITLLPLLFILAVSALKEIAEDRKRHVTDKKNNQHPVECLVLKNWKIITWEQIHVGDIVRIHNKEYFPADLVLFSSSNSDGMSFVQTMNLDGESNLKMRQALPETVHLIDERSLSEFRGTIECQIPNRRIYDFFGVLKQQNAPAVAFGANQFLQRGAALSNTKWVIGVVVYTGHDTKLMKSLARTPLKSSSVDRLLNKQFCSLFGIYLLTALVSAGMNTYWEHENAKKHLYLGLPQATHVKTIILNCLSCLILYNNMIPISLQVTLEMVHFFQAIFINYDVEMYHEETNTPAIARSSNLNEELGMVQYVLTDKTGTLTRNVMKYKMCSIAGILYDINEEEDMENSELLRNLREGHPTQSVIEEFMLLIVLCHSVVTEIKEDGTVIYHATNPDDQAIIEGSEACGYKFITRGGDYIDIVRFGEPVRYTLLQTIEFSSSRKRMSVLIRMPDGKIKLFCKGADTIIFDRLASDSVRDYYDITKQHLNELARQGYRTLCCGVTEISEEKYSQWIELYREASVAFTDREEKMETLAEEVEVNLTLLGVTAIEDKLQDGVPDTLRFLLAAGIRIWMLTGDKQETAINIGFSSGLLNQNMRLIVVNEEDLRSTYEKLSELITKKTRFHHVALVVNGRTLEFALNKSVYEVFKSVCLQCRVVICCRLSPMQKGRITELVNSTGACTLAIGDGANDVSMIRKARVGIGISGYEGYQAAAASDYSIGQFRFLKRLLFVHGTWNFHRITTLTLYSFYKNIILSIMMMWFSFTTGWSAQVLFDRWVIALYNLAHTSWPPLAIGIFDKVCSAQTLLKYPRIYSRAQNSKLFNVGIFWVWLLNSFLHSALLFWVPFFIFNRNSVIWPEGRPMDLIIHGNFVYTAAVTVVCLKAGIILHSWNYLVHISIWGSLLLWILTIILYSHFWPAMKTGEMFVYSDAMMFPSLMFWFFVTISTVITLLPDFFLKVFLNRYFLPLNDISLLEKEEKA